MHEKRNVAVLAVSQALSQSVAVIVMTIGGLAGLMLADDKSLATLPIAMMFVGTASATIPASLFMGRVGRQTGFIVGALIGATGGGLMAAAVASSDFALLCVATFLVGAYVGFAQFYRFAAAEAAGAAFRSRAISYVLAGGVVAAVAGPAIANWTTDLIGSTRFLATGLSMGLLALISAAVLVSLAIPTPTASGSANARPLREIVVEPVFIVALLGASSGFGVMVLAMTATPLAMVGHGHGIDDAAFVIQWHVLGMFVPSFFTGALIQRFGVLRIMMSGIALLSGHVAIAVSGMEMLQFVSALVLLGVGWNFLYIGGTTLLTSAYQGPEKSKVQATNDFVVLGFAMAGSFSAGTLLHGVGWIGVNLTALPFLVLAALAILLLQLRRSRTARA